MKVNLPFVLLSRVNLCLVFFLLPPSQALSSIAPQHAMKTTLQDAGTHHARNLQQTTMLFNDTVCQPFAVATPEASCSCLVQDPTVYSVQCIYPQQCLTRQSFEALFGQTCEEDTVEASSCVDFTQQVDFAQQGESFVLSAKQTVASISKNGGDDTNTTSLRFVDSSSACEVYVHFHNQEAEQQCTGCNKDGCDPGTYRMDCSNIQEGARNDVCQAQPSLSLCGVATEDSFPTTAPVTEAPIDVTGAPTPPETGEPTSLQPSSAFQNRPGSGLLQVIVSLTFFVQLELF